STISYALRFPGHYFDDETELHYNRFRYYSPRLGRYLQCDPMGQAGGVNVYAYPANPLVSVDVFGLMCGSRNREGSASIDQAGQQKQLQRTLRNKMKRIRNHRAAGGNRGISGTVSKAAAMRLGIEFVGPGYRVMSNGHGYVSEDGLRTFRFPSKKRGIN